MTSTLHEALSTFLILSCSILLRVEKFGTKLVEKFKTHVLCAIYIYIYIFKSYLFKIISKITAELGIIRRTRISSWIPKATHEHPEYVILNAFLLQQWLHEAASMLRHRYSACLVGHT